MSTGIRSILWSGRTSISIAIIFVAHETSAFFHLVNLLIRPPILSKDETKDSANWKFQPKLGLTQYSTLGNYSNGLTAKCSQIVSVRDFIFLIAKIWRNKRALKATKNITMGKVYMFYDHFNNYWVNLCAGAGFFLSLKFRKF